MTIWLWVTASYLLGAIPTSYLAARYGAGINLREHGSKNLGATNVYRVLGWKYAVPVGLFDVAKGAVPVALFGPLAGDEPWIPILLGVAAVVWVLVLAVTGYVSAASMLGAVLFPFAARLTNPENPYIFGLGIALAAFILITHRSNIRRLASGEENRFGRRWRHG